MGADDVLSRARAFWARRAGVAVANWQDGRTLAVDTEHPSVSTVLMGGALIWCPPQLRPRVAELTPEAAADLRTLAETCADVLDEPIGSAALMYVSADTFRRPGNDLEVSVERRPVPGYESFLAACAPEERAESGLPADPDQRCWVSRVGADIAALVTYEVWDETVAHLVVLTAPTYRGAGHASRAAAAACADLLRENELLPQWRVSDANLASLAVARKLGFVTLGRQSTIVLARR